MLLYERRYGSNELGKAYVRLLKALWVERFEL